MGGGGQNPFQNGLELFKSPTGIHSTMVVFETVYFEEGGPEHTRATLEASVRAAQQLGVGTLVVASTTGDTGVKAAELCRDAELRLVVVGHQMGFPEEGVQRFKPENFERITELGGAVCLGTDVLTNSIRRRQRLGHSPLSTITQCLSAVKLKVNVEIVAKACDAGLVKPGERVISVAGSHWGADTAAVFTAADSAHILDVRPLLFICYPMSREKADAEYLARRKAQQV